MASMLQNGPILKITVTVAHNQHENNFSLSRFLSGSDQILFGLDNILAGPDNLDQIISGLVWAKEGSTYLHKESIVFLLYKPPMSPTFSQIGPSLLPAEDHLIVLRMWPNGLTDKIEKRMGTRFTKNHLQSLFSHFQSWMLPGDSLCISIRKTV